MSERLSTRIPRPTPGEPNRGVSALHANSAAAARIRMPAGCGADIKCSFQRQKKRKKDEEIGETGPRLDLGLQERHSFVFSTSESG